MNKLLTFPTLLLLVSCLLSLSSCSKDEEEPRIDGVWYNMVSRPIEQAPCAYPGQTISVRGAHLDNLRHVIVNGTEIDVRSILEYQSESAVTFQLPNEVGTTGDYVRVVTAYGKADYRFVVRPKSEQPSITSFSSTTLVPGTTLVITGTNLSGAKEVWLPQTFNGRIQCEFDASQTNSDTQVYVKIPAEAAFATGRCEIVMDKSDSERGITYVEKVFSGKTDFKN